MANKTGQELVDDARSRAGYQATGFVLDAEILGWVNDECNALRDLIIAQDESYYSAPYAFTLPDSILAAACIVASVSPPPPNFAALPDGCDRVQGLDLANGQGAFTSGGGPAGQRPTTIHEFNFAQRNDLQGPRYRLFGRIADTEVLMVQPEENSAGQYRLWYIPQFTPLTLVTSLDSIMQRFNRFISIGAAIRILTKAKRDTTALMQDQAKVTAAVQTMSQNRDSEADQGGSDGRADAMRRWPYYWGR